MERSQLHSKSTKNDRIYECFQHICKQDEHRFVREFQQRPHTCPEKEHLYRELILGAYLNSKGFAARYARKIDGKTPDWTIFDDEEKTVIAIIELANLQIYRTAKNQFDKRLLATGGRSSSYWPNATKDKDNERLWDCLREKAGTYKNLVEKLRVPYIVGITPNHPHIIALDTLHRCLFDNKTGLFNTTHDDGVLAYAHLSGVLHFEQGISKPYEFTYLSNPNALRTMTLPSSQL